nr:FAD-dependent oxidoreductase [Kofleriaceae bacterium]
MRFAIVGSGIAGLAAAHALAGAHDVVVYEAAAHAGGHVYTVDAGGVAVDMGFIVHNRDNYPRFCALLDDLGVATRPTSMAFSVSLPRDDLEWGSASLGAMFADRRRLADRRHWRFLVEVVRFLRRARRDLGGALVARASLDDYLEARRVHADVRDRFVVPLAAALWSLAPDRCGAFPAETYLRFLDQHGMLRAARPLPWRTIDGGSKVYVDALVARLRARGRFELRLATPVTAVHRDARGATIVAGGLDDRFDRVIVATHADTALALVDAPSDGERRVLGAFRYSSNRTVLHRDRAALPRAGALHAAWNYVGDPDTARVAVTYSMTRLQGLPDVPYLVTLNPRREPAGGALHEVWLDHPQFDRAALDAQPELARVGAAHRTYYAGAHTGFGFHEDGMRSGLAAAARALADEVVAR